MSIGRAGVPVPRSAAPEPSDDSGGGEGPGFSGGPRPSRSCSRACSRALTSGTGTGARGRGDRPNTPDRREVDPEVGAWRSNPSRPETEPRPEDRHRTPNRPESAPDHPGPASNDRSGAAHTNLSRNPRFASVDFQQMRLRPAKLGLRTAEQTWHHVKAGAT